MNNLKVYCVDVLNVMKSWKEIDDHHRLLINDLRLLLSTFDKGNKGNSNQPKIASGTRSEICTDYTAKRPQIPKVSFSDYVTVLRVGGRGGSGIRDRPC